MAYGNFTWTLWLLNPWDIWKYLGGKSKVPNWIGVAKWVASFLKLTSMSRCFSFLPSPSRSWSAPLLCIRSNLLLTQSSVYSWTSGLIDKERSCNGEGADMLLQRGNRLPFPDLNPILFPNTWSLAHCCFSQLQITEGRDALAQVGGPSWLWKPSQLLVSLRSALLVSGALVRLRELRCDDLSREFVPREGVESRQRKQNGTHSQHCWLQGDRGTPEASCLDVRTNLRAFKPHCDISRASFSFLYYGLSKVDKYLCGWILLFLETQMWIKVYSRWWEVISQC